MKKITLLLFLLVTCNIVQAQSIKARYDSVQVKAAWIAAQTGLGLRNVTPLDYAKIADSLSAIGKDYTDSVNKSFVNVYDSLAAFHSFIDTILPATNVGGVVSSQPSIGDTITPTNAGQWLNREFYKRVPTLSVTGSISYGGPYSAILQIEKNSGTNPLMYEVLSVTTLVNTLPITNEYFNGYSISTIAPISNPGTATDTTSAILTSNTYHTDVFKARTNDGNIATGLLQVQWLSKKYWGYASTNSPSDANLIAAAGGSSIFQRGNNIAESQALNITVSGSNKYIFFAYQSSFDTLTSLTIGGVNALSSFTHSTRAVVNASGYSATYEIYVSTATYSNKVIPTIIVDSIQTSIPFSDTCSGCIIATQSMINPGGAIPNLAAVLTAGNNAASNDMVVRKITASRFVTNSGTTAGSNGRIGNLFMQDTNLHTRVATGMGDTGINKYFFIRRFNDTGVAINDIVDVNLLTGITTWDATTFNLNGDLNCANILASTNLSAYNLSSFSPSTTNGGGQYYWIQGGIERWEFDSKNLETGGNVGSDMYILAYDDTGASLGYAYSIKRSTQVVNFFQTPTVGSVPILLNNRTISTTSPLTGGGALSSNLTLAIPVSTNSVNGYLDSNGHKLLASALQSETDPLSVHLTGTQTVAGAKKFTNTQTIVNTTIWDRYNDGSETATFGIGTGNANFQTNSDNIVFSPNNTESFRFSNDGTFGVAGADNFPTYASGTKWRMLYNQSLGILQKEIDTGGSGGLSGLTATYMPVATSATTIGNSTITVDGGGNMAEVGAITAGGNIQGFSITTSNHFACTQLITSIVAGAGAGSAPTITCTGCTDQYGTISITTGSTPAIGSVVATITFGSGYGSTPTASICAQDLNAATAFSSVVLYPTLTTGTLVINTINSLIGTTTYLIGYRVN